MIFKSDKLFEMLAEIRTEGENAIREIFTKLGTKKLNVEYYEENYGVERSGFSSYDSNGYSSPSWIKTIELQDDGSIEVILDGDWECETYVEDMMANEVAITLDILEQCVGCIEDEGADIISEYPEED